MQCCSGQQFAVSPHHMWSLQHTQYWRRSGLDTSHLASCIVSVDLFPYHTYRRGSCVHPTQWLYMILEHSACVWIMHPPEAYHSLWIYVSVWIWRPTWYAHISGPKKNTLYIDDVHVIWWWYRRYNTVVGIYNLFQKFNATISTRFCMWILHTPHERQYNCKKGKPHCW